MYTLLVSQIMYHLLIFNYNFFIISDIDKYLDYTL